MYDNSPKPIRNFPQTSCMTDYSSYMALDNPMVEEAREYTINQFAEPYAKHHGTIELYTIALLIDISDKLGAIYLKR